MTSDIGRLGLGRSRTSTPTRSLLDPSQSGLGSPAIAPIQRRSRPSPAVPAPCGQRPRTPRRGERRKTAPAARRSRAAPRPCQDRRPTRSRRARGHDETARAIMPGDAAIERSDCTGDLLLHRRGSAVTRRHPAVIGADRPWTWLEKVLQRWLTCNWRAAVQLCHCDRGNRRMAPPALSSFASWTSTSMSRAISFAATGGPFGLNGSRWIS